VAALIASLVAISPHAYSVAFNLLPSDSLAGGGSGNIPFTMSFGGNSANWPTTDSCLRSTGSGGYVTCAAFVSEDRIALPYTGQVFVRRMDCAPNFDHLLWDATGTPSISISVFEMEGGGTGSVAFDRNQIGGAITFLKTDEPMVTRSLPINLPTTIENGSIQVKVSAIDAGGTPSVQNNAFTCTVSLYE